MGYEVEPLYTGFLAGARGELEIVYFFQAKLEENNMQK